MQDPSVSRTGRRGRRGSARLRAADVGGLRRDDGGRPRACPAALGDRGLLAADDGQRHRTRPTVGARRRDSTGSRCCAGPRVCSRVLDEVSRNLESLIAEGDNILVVADARGRVLWRSGSASVLNHADRLGFIEGAHWGESAVGTNAHRHRAGLQPGGAGVLRRALPAQPSPVDVRGRADQGSPHRARSSASSTCRGPRRRCTRRPSRWSTSSRGSRSPACANSTTGR